MDLFLDAHRAAPSEIILDLDATDDPLHGHQPARLQSLPISLSLFQVRAEQVHSAAVP